MRCLDSGVLSYTETRRNGTAWCGNCGRRVGIDADDRLAEHGDRRPCETCGSRSPRHHISEHN